MFYFCLSFKHIEMLKFTNFFHGSSVMVTWHACKQFLIFSVSLLFWFILKLFVLIYNFYDLIISFSLNS